MADGSEWVGKRSPRPGVPVSTTPVDRKRGGGEVAANHAGRRERPSRDRPIASRGTCTLQEGREGKGDARTDPVPHEHDNANFQPNFDRRTGRREKKTATRGLHLVVYHPPTPVRRAGRNKAVPWAPPIMGRGSHEERTCTSLSTTTTAKDSGTTAPAAISRLGRSGSPPPGSGPRRR